MRKLSLLCFALLLFSCKPVVKEKTTSVEIEEWLPLFNGKDLTNWTPKIKGYAFGENIYNTFRVEDGVIKVAYDGYDGAFKNRFGHLYYKTPFSNYRLKMQYRFTGKQLKDGPGWAKRNSGVMIHCENPENIGLNQNFPLCIEVQMLGGITEGSPRSTGNLCTPATNVVMDGKLITAHCINSSSETYYGEQWVDLEVEVHNDSLIIHKINNKEVLRYSKPQIGGGDLTGGANDDYNEDYKNRFGEPVKEGYISLQSESHPVEFRNIKLLKL